MDSCTHTARLGKCTEYFPHPGEVPHETLTLLFHGSEVNAVLKSDSAEHCSCCSEALHFASAFWENTCGGLIHVLHDSPAQASQDKLQVAPPHVQVGADTGCGKQRQVGQSSPGV